MKRTAFSLVELSIVLVILGLLTGGILAGQSLIRAAELRSVTTQFQRYVTAAQSFRDKYFAYPGDFNNAQAFWGAQGTNCSGTVTTLTTTGTCNGNGNGTIDNAAAASSNGERFQFWRQLALAGLIEGNYSGISGGGGAADTNSANAPVGRIASTLWGVGSYITSGNATYFDGNVNTAYSIGALMSGSGPNNPILKPEEAWNIDTKMDDGKPATGKVIGNMWNVCSTAASSSDTTAQYKLSDSGLDCILDFMSPF